MNRPTLVPGIMSGTLGARPPTSSQLDATNTKKRNRMLCQRCRHDKQGCHPQTRDWDRGEKCERCQERGYDCSAPEKAPFKKRKRRATLATSIVHTLSHTSASTSPDDATSMQRLTPTVSAPTPADPRSRTLVAWGPGDESIPPTENTALPSAQPDPESIVVSMRKPNEQKARIILAKLGDLNATRIILLSDLKLCDQVESWVGRSASVEKIRAAIKAAIAAIKHDFKTGVEMARPFIEAKDVGPYKEAFVSQLQLVMHQFCHPIATESSMTDEDRTLMEGLHSDDVQEKLHELHKRKRVWSAANYLFGNAYGRLSSRHAIHGQSENDVVLCYVKASESIKEVFCDIVLEDLDHREILCSGFGQASDSISALPPCHLAVSQANSSVLLALWNESAMFPWDVDYLHRTPVHSATYAGKVQGLHTIWQTNPSTTMNTGCDSFGMTPLAIAACKDDVKTFIRLVQAGAIIEGRSHKIFDDAGKTISILGLAARNGSVNVVKYIVSHPCSLNFQTENSELCQALSNNQPHIASILIDWHCKPMDCHCNFINGQCGCQKYSLSNQLIPAQQIAEKKGLQDVSTRLKSLIPSRDDGIRSLDAMVFDTFTNHDVFGDDHFSYDSSQFDSSQGYEFDPVIWSFSETHAPSFTQLDMLNPVVPTPSPDSRTSFATPSNQGIRQVRHRGPTRMEPS